MSPAFKELAARLETRPAHYHNESHSSSASLEAEELKVLIFRATFKAQRRRDFLGWQHSKATLIQIAL